VRWDNLRIDGAEPSDEGGTAPLPLLGEGVVERTFDTPEFRGITFYEVRARSAINRVPAASRMPFRWTINPYRGCSHACVYCFARKTHTYLDLDAGADFDSRIVVKTNTPALVRRELAAASWGGEHIAMGTNVDCYQRAEGRYRLMPGVIEALRDYANPFSILTKGSLILRDLDLLTEAAAVTDVAVNVSVGFVDKTVWRLAEPGTPSPQKRLEVCRTLTDAGIGCGVLMAPVLPYLTDSDEQLEATVRAIAEAGARSVTPIVLHLRPGAREWYLAWLRRHRPDLLPRYATLYGNGAYADAAYQQDVADRVQVMARRHGAERSSPQRARRVPEQTGHVPAQRPGRAPGADQLTLL